MKKYALSLFLMAAINAAAQEEGVQEKVAKKPVKLETIEVIAEKVDNSIETIEGDDIQFMISSTLRDIFRKNPQVSVGGGGLPLAQKVYVRGFEDTLMNVSIDGATQAGQAYHHQSRVYIDPELIKAVQVEAGAGAATNGPGALAGAIRYETKSASDLLREGENFGGIVKSGFYSNTEGWKGSLTLYGNATENLQLLATVSRAETGDWEDGEGTKWANSDTNQEIGFIKADYRFDEANRMSLSYENSSDEALRNNRANYGYGFNHPWQPNALIPQETVRQTVIYNHYFNPEDNDLIDVRLTAFYTENELERDLELASTTPTYGNAGVESYGLDLRNTSIFGDHGMTYGLDYRHDRGYAQNVFTYTAPFTPPIIQVPDGSNEADVFGLYIQDNWRFAEDWLFTAGTRYDWYDYSGSGGNQSSTAGFSPNVGLTYFATDEFSVYANFSQVVRGVGIPESYWSAWEYPVAANVDEERATNYEVGFTYDDNSLFFGLELFRQYIDDVITDPSTNAGDLKADGYTAYLGYRYEGLTAKLTVTDSNPELDGDELYTSTQGIGFKSGRTWLLDLNYDIPEANLRLGWISKFAEGHLNRGTSINSYDVHNIYAQWQPTGEDDWTVNLAINNIFDQHYFEHTTIGGMPEMGLDARVEVAYKF